MKCGIRETDTTLSLGERFFAIIQIDIVGAVLKILGVP
jgi:hypothetical protein